MEDNKKSVWESALFRVGLTYLMFLALSYICRLAVTVASIAMSSLDIRLLYGVNLAAQILCLQTAIYVFSYNNPVAQKQYLDLGIKGYSFSNECKRLLKSFSFWMEYLFIGFLLFILPSGASLLSYEMVLFGENLPSNGLLRFIKLGIVVLLVFLEMIISKTNAVKNWQMHLNPADIRKMSSPAHLVMTVLINLFGYFAACCVIPLLYLPISTIPKLFKNTNIIQVVGILVGVVVALEILSILRPLRLRRKFMKFLYKKAKENGFRITEKKHVYLSSIFVKCSGFITIEAYDSKAKGYKSYKVRLIAIKKARQSLVFQDYGQAYIIRPFFRSEALAINTFFSYQFESNATKILLVTNTPNKMLLEENGSKREISTGEKIADYFIYYPENFFGVVERGLVAKKHYFDE